MVNFSGCQRIGIEKLKHDVDHFRTRDKDYPDDELLMTEDEKYLVLCHTINEGSNGRYYTQIVIMLNDARQTIKMNMLNAWFPLWMQNFYYLAKSNEFILSLTCYDSTTRNNSTPSLILNFASDTMTLLPRNIIYDALDEGAKAKLTWRKLDDNPDYCKLFLTEYGG